MTNSVRHRLWGFLCPALGPHAFLCQPPEPRMRQMNELQGVKITLCLSNLSSNLLAYKLPVSFGYSLLETPFPSSPPFPAPPHPCPSRHDTKNSSSSPHTQGVASSSGSVSGTLRDTRSSPFLYKIPQALKFSRVWEVLVDGWTADLCKVICEPAREDFVFQDNWRKFLLYHQIPCYLLAGGSHAEGALFEDSCTQFRCCKTPQILQTSSHPAQQGPGPSDSLSMPPVKS